MTKRSASCAMLIAAGTLALVACQVPSTLQGGQQGGGTGVAAATAPQGRTPGAGGIPSGTIVAFYGTELPMGWALCDGRVTASGRRTPDLRNRFILGLDPASPAALGEAGGAPTHQHAAEIDPPRGERERIESGRDEHAANDDHTHPITIRSASNLPPYVKLVYIMKD
jgi:hypothetical protein